MRASRVVNTTIYHLRRHLFGPGRLGAGNGRLARVHLTPRRVAQVGFHGTQRLRQSPPFFGSRVSPAFNDSFTPKAWPYDTAFPSGLPEVAVFAGQALADMPSTGAQLAKAKSADNPLSVGLPSAKPGSSDHLGRLIDVFA